MENRLYSSWEIVKMLFEGEIEEGTKLRSNHNVNFEIFRSELGNLYLGYAESKEDVGSSVLSLGKIRFYPVKE